MSETLIATFSTWTGRTVEVVNVTVERAPSLTEAAEGSGPIWRCGCGARSDKPLNSSFFSDPIGIVSAAASGHANSCYVV